MDLLSEAAHLKERSRHVRNSYRHFCSQVARAVVAFVKEIVIKSKNFHHNKPTNDYNPTKRDIRSPTNSPQEGYPPNLYLSDAIQTGRDYDLSWRSEQRPLVGQQQQLISRNDERVAPLLVNVAPW